MISSVSNPRRRKCRAVVMPTTPPPRIAMDRGLMVSVSLEDIPHWRKVQEQPLEKQTNLLTMTYHCACRSADLMNSSKKLSDRR